MSLQVAQLAKFANKRSNLKGIPPNLNRHDQENIYF